MPRPHVNQKRPPIVNAIYRIGNIAYVELLVFRPDAKQETLNKVASLAMQGWKMDKQVPVECWTIIENRESQPISEHSLTFLYTVAFQIDATSK